MELRSRCLGFVPPEGGESPDCHFPMEISGFGWIPIRVWGEGPDCHFSMEIGGFGSIPIRVWGE